MAINLDQLRRHYDSLSDDALRAVDRKDLVPEAQRCYDEEVARRRIEQPSDPDLEQQLVFEGEEEPDWLEQAISVFTIVESPGGYASADAEEARETLVSAGIPSSISFLPATPGDQAQWRVLVPGALELLAMSVLDREIFNQRLEETWRAHFEVLSNADLAALSAQEMCAGFLDRAERLKSAYQDELKRRGLGAG